jgi:hypothetical protein
MAVGADQAIRERHAIAHLHDLGDIFQIHLVHDARGRGDDAEILERLLAPFQEFISLAIALEFLLGVVDQREAVAEIIHLHAVIDDQIDRNQRVDLLRIAAGAFMAARMRPDRPRTARP